jgi:kinesin family protein 2/24
VIAFYEIYGGKLFDLLNKREALKALVDAAGDVKVVGLSEQRVANISALLQAIDLGMSSRSTGSTGANSESSRSHALLQVTLAEAVADGKGGLHVLTDPRTKNVKAKGKFSFIDLAGSERGADTTNNDKKTRQEGAEINKSLLALKECIRSLYQMADYNPFRGSKLTQVRMRMVGPPNRFFPFSSLPFHFPLPSHTPFPLPFSFNTPLSSPHTGTQGLFHG